jgi:hypothetical protein
MSPVNWYDVLANNLTANSSWTAFCSIYKILLSMAMFQALLSVSLHAQSNKRSIKYPQFDAGRVDPRVGSVTDFCKFQCVGSRNLNIFIQFLQIAKFCTE